MLAPKPWQKKARLKMCACGTCQPIALRPNQNGMHICFINEFPFNHQPAGGIASFLLNLTSDLVKEGIKVSVVSSNPDFHGRQILENGVSVYWVKPPKKRTPIRFLQIRWLIRQAILGIHREYPITILESNEVGLYGVPHLKQVQYCIRLHGGHYFFSQTLGTKRRLQTAYTERESMKRANAIIGVTRFAYEVSKAFHDFGSKKKAIIPYPIVTSRYYLSSPEEIVAGRIVFVGSITAKKGIRELIKAIAIVREKNPLVHLEVYGRDVPDRKTGNSYLAEMKALTQNLGISEWVIFKGTISNLLLPEALEKAAVAAFPSHSETQGIVALEAMSMGKPVVFSKLGPGPETIDHGIDGLLCDPKDPGDIAEKILWCLNHPNEAQQMGILARQKVLERYDHQVIVKQNINFYKELAQDLA